MSILINEKLKLVFLSQPKCASEYMEYILKNFYDFNIFINSQINELKNTSQEIYVKNIVDNYFNVHNINEKYDDYTFFSLVRNPYEKFLSGFLYYYGTPFMMSNIPKLCIFTDPNKCSSKYSLLEDFNISHFNSLTDAINDKNNLYENNIRAYAHLFISQSSLLNSINHNKKIIKIEELPDSLNNFFDELSIKVIHQNYPKSNDTIRYHAMYHYFTDENIIFINNYFSNDFVDFGYKKFNTVEEMKVYYREEEDINFTYLS